MLLLVRHGQSTWNAAGRCQGQSPSAGGLTAAGEAQALATAEELANNLARSEEPLADAILASDLPRARQTAEIIARVLGLPVRLDAGLREQSLGELEGRLYTEQFGELTVQGTIDELWRDPFRTPPGGESVADMYQRVQATLTRLSKLNTERTLVVATHGGVVRTATAATPQPGTPLPHTTVDNASITPWSPSCPVP